jgi:hypothetical protein
MVQWTQHEHKSHQHTPTSIKPNPWTLISLPTTNISLIFLAVNLLNAHFLKRTDPEVQIEYLSLDLFLSGLWLLLEPLQAHLNTAMSRRMVSKQCQRFQKEIILVPRNSTFTRCCSLSCSASVWIHYVPPAASSSINRTLQNKKEKWKV